MDYVVRSGPKISLDHNRIRRVFFCHPSPQGACRSLLRMNTISEMNHTYQVFQIRPLSAEWSRRQQRNLDQLPDSLKRWEGGSWVFELDSTLRLGVVRIKSSNGKSPFCGGPRNENLKKSISRFLELTLRTKWILPYGRVWKLCHKMLLKIVKISATYGFKKCIT